jgi:hypothetical protein
MIRKQLIFILAQDKNIDPKETKGLIVSTSMDARTGSNPEFGGLSGIMRDTEWIATSQDTFSNLQGLFSTVEKDNSKCEYIVIDEFEIGCGEETVLALSQFLNDNLIDLIGRGKIRGAMIITHSRIGVENLIFDNFVNIEGLTKDEWLNRKIIPTDLIKLDSNELFFYIRDKQNKNK